jgi:uncharacterized protein (TIGR03083 family)
MPMHPAPPQGLHDLVEAFAQTAQAVADLARTCSDDDLAQPTDCPGWTVHDQIAHVAGVEAWLGGHKDPRVEMPHYEHVRSDLGKKVEFAVEVRRRRTGAQLVAELEQVLAERLSTLRDPMLTDSSIIAGPFGPDQATTVMLLRTFDVWAHEQDIRSALGRAGNLDSPAAATFVSTVLRALPKLVARDAGLEPGQCVVIEVGDSGPAGSAGSAVTAREGVRVEMDDQGRPRGEAVPPDDAILTDNATLTGNGTPSPDQPRVAQVTAISLSAEAFTRRAAGRRTVSDTAYSVVGDDAVARRVLEALVVTR